ncbi:MAG: TetR/AcrR family transcriptional regulator [bacterium]|nr:TetR/AcrR family transcriptional regulator [bacterium]
MADNDVRRRDSDETTTRLLDAAAEVFVEHGYDKAVIADIARRAGVTTGAVFGRWANKSELMAAAVDHIFDQILPDQRIKQLGIDDVPVTDIFSAWAANILSGDETQDVMVQVFASARNNDAVRQRLQWFLDEQAQQIAHLIDRGRIEVDFDPGYSTAAVALLIQAVGVGIHLLLSAGRDEQHIPSAQEWETLIRGLFHSLTTPPPQ